MKQLSITENQRSISGVAFATHTFSLTSGSYTASSDSITIPKATIKAKYNTNSDGRSILSDFIWVTPIINGVSGDTDYSYYVNGPLAYNTDATMANYKSVSWTFSTSSLFNANNKTSRTVNINWKIEAQGSMIGTAKPDPYNTGGYLAIAQYGIVGNWYSWTISSEGTVTLNAPPTFTAAATSTGPYYANVSTYRVNLTNLSAKYGGTISSAVLTVGNKTASRTTNGELAVALNNTGTFTPTVKVTDSRGQATTVNLSAITVASHTSPTVTAETTSTGPYYTTGTSYTAVTSNPVTYDDVPVSSISITIGSQTVSDDDVGQLTISPNTAGTFIPIITITDAAGASSSVQLQPITVLQYSSPTINGSVIQRTESTGKPNEEDTSAVIGYQLTWVEDLGHIQRPKVHIGTSTTEATVTWYKVFDPTSMTQTYLSNPITDWDTIVSGDIVYAFIANEFLIGDSYVINATASDDFTTSVVISMTLAQAFFTIDFLAGGHGIAFGQLATEEGFFCNMDAHFKDKANVMRALFDFVYPIGSYYETSDSSFNPNTAWGGTWVLETEGLVHVSSGSTYTTGSTGGDESKTYTPQGSVQSHTLTESEMPSHVGHLPVNSGSHTGYGNAPGKYLPLSSMSSYGSAGRGWDDNGTEYTMSGVSRGGGKGHTHGFSGTQASIDVMQPYIVVNRWHRTA